MIRDAVPVYLRDLATGRDRLLGTLENWRSGFTVSPDGKTILYTKVVGEGSDLMLIENFRWPLTSTSASGRGRGSFPLDAEDRQGLSEAELVAVHQLPRRRKPLLPQVGAVLAPEIFESEPAALREDAGVAS